jgi:hypothetical protein
MVVLRQVDLSCSLTGRIVGQVYPLVTDSIPALGNASCAIECIVPVSSGMA